MNRPPVQVRKFEMSPAKFNGTSLLIGLVAPSGAGKTRSALELAKGIQVVTGGPIGILDTENERSLHYASMYQFALPDGKPGLMHVPFHPPFNPASYQTAYEFMAKAGVKIVITDSFSHEHEGEGGVLDMHHEDILAGMKDPNAWSRGKGERLDLIGRILQMRGQHWIFCYRAKEKMRWHKGRPPEARGLMPQGNESFIYETTVNFLLPAGANGVPVVASPYPDEELIIKIPGQYRHLFTEPRQLSAALGTHLAAWAVPSWKGTLPPLPTPLKQGQSTSVSYSTSEPGLKPAPEVAPVVAPAPAAPIQAAVLENKTVLVGDSPAPVSVSPNAEGISIGVRQLTALYNLAATLEIAKGYRDRCVGILALCSAEDAAELRAAANAALDRLELPATADSGIANGESPPAPELSAIEKLNAEGLARFRAALNDAGTIITQEEAAQLVRDHLADYAPRPKVGTEDGPMAQDEIMKRTQPPFASRASLGVMRRHLENCDAHPTYKTFCQDLALCMTAENVYECWRINGEIVDALPDQPCKDARSRAVKQVETVDPTIKDGGPWLTKRIREGKAKALADAPTVAAAAAPAPAPITKLQAEADEAQTKAFDEAQARAAAPTEPVAPVKTPADHTPLKSDIGTRLALDIDTAVSIDVLTDVGTRIGRAKLQKKIPDEDYTTLTALHAAKQSTFSVQATA